MAVLFASCGKSGVAPKTAPAPAPEPPATLPPIEPPLRPESRPVLPTVQVQMAPANINVDSVLATLSVRRKVGQLIMPWLLGNYAGYDAEDYDAVNNWVDSLGIGG